MSEANYYACRCGGTFHVDLRAQSYGIYPCVYVYQCDGCPARKSMPCLAEVKEIRAAEQSEFDKRNPVKRVFRLR